MNKSDLTKILKDIVVKHPGKSNKELYERLPSHPLPIFTIEKKELES